MELVGDERDAFVVAGLGEMIFVGVIQESEPAAWQGTRLHAEGRVKPRDCAIPLRVRAHLLAGVELDGVAAAKAGNFGG